MNESKIKWIKCIFFNGQLIHFVTIWSPNVICTIISGCLFHNWASSCKNRGDPVFFSGSTEELVRRFSRPTSSTKRSSQAVLVTTVSHPSKPSVTPPIHTHLPTTLANFKGTDTKTERLSAECYRQRTERAAVLDPWGIWPNDFTEMS